MFAELSPAAKRRGLSASQLQELARQSGLELCLFQKDAFQSIEKKSSKGELGRFHVGTRSDAQLTVTIAKDGLSATLDLEPACGGAPVSPKGLEAELSGKGIVSRCVDKKCLKDLLTELKQNPKLQQRVIANAIDPVQGSDASFEVLVQHCTQIRPKEIEAGRVDQKDIRDFIVVEPGTPLMRRHPPGEGVPGTTVTGSPIAAKGGADRAFEKKLDGVNRDEDNPDLLVAEIKGIPFFTDNGVKVEPVLTLKNVDVSTGNVDFDGTINITGGIDSDFAVKASGDIMVKGLVERSSLIAGRNIVIGGGVLGDVEDHEPSLTSTTRLQAEEIISAKFISNTYIESKGDLNIKEYILNSEINIRGVANLGQEGGEGRLLGGHLHAERGVNANILGSDGYIKTKVSAGCAPELRETLAKQMSERTRRGNECFQLQGILEKLVQSGNIERVGKIALAKNQKIQNTITALQTKVEELDLTINEIEQRVESVLSVAVKSEKQVYPGVIINVDNGAHQTEYFCERETGKLSVGGEPEENKEPKGKSDE